MPNIEKKQNILDLNNYPSHFYNIAIKDKMPKMYNQSSRSKSTKFTIYKCHLYYLKIKIPKELKTPLIYQHLKNSLAQHESSIQIKTRLTALSKRKVDTKKLKVQKINGYYL